MKIQTTRSDIIWNYIGTLVSLGFNFLLVPFLLIFLDTNHYGLWNIFVSVGGITVLFDFGFNSVFARNIAYCWSGAKHLSKEDVEAISDETIDFKLFCKVLTTCRIIYLVISTLTAVILLSLGSIYIIHICTPELDISKIIVAWLIYSVGVYLNLLYGYYDSFLRGIGLVYFVNKARVLAKLIQLALSIVLLALGLGMIGLAIAFILYGISFRISCKKKFYSYEGIGNKLKTVDKPSIKDIWELFVIVWHNTWREGIVSVSNYFCNQATTIICSLYLGLGDTARYSLATQLSSAIAQISLSYFNSFLPAIQYSYAKRDSEKIRKIMSIGTLIFEALFPLGLIAVIVVFIPLLKHIRPDSVISIPILITISIYHFILKKRDCYALYLAGTNRMVYYKAFFFSSLLCIITSFFGASVLKIGIWELVIAQIFSQIIYNAWHWQFVVDKELELSTLKKVEYLREYLYNLFSNKLEINRGKKQK